MDKDKKQDSEPLSFEADFTRHIFSLFASLYDSRASPYIGPMPPTEEAPVEEEDDLESEPPFASSLCDFRLRTAYQNEVDSRPQVLEEMAAKAETIQGNASNPDAPKELILGERLPARLASGKTSEIELRKQRLEAIEKSRRCAELRKDRENEERRKRAQKVLDVDRREQMESGGLATASVFAADITRQSIIPEIDATRLAGIYAAMNGDATGIKATNLGSYTPSAATVLSEIEKGIDAVAENWSTDSGYTIYISTAVKSLLRASSEVTKTRDITSGATRLTTDTTDIDGCPIVWVPKSRMKTAYSYLDIDKASSLDGGITPASAAQDINFIICAPGVANGIIAVNNEKIIMKEQNQRKDADSLYMRVFHDVIVPKNKICGAYVSVAPASGREPESEGETQQTQATKTRSK